MLGNHYRRTCAPILSCNLSLSRTAPSIGLPQNWQAGTPRACFGSVTPGPAKGGPLLLRARCCSASHSAQVRWTSGEPAVAVAVGTVEKLPYG